ncbi:drug resistance transporter, EmrB/QacA subfamily [Frankineae bacterium MT45]|nr:drug resistance transporter, EmrB/QacA subfamily [Frankineae bacterium MT45]
MTIELKTAAGRGVLAATILGAGMSFLDSTVVNVATRQIGIDFHATFAELQWVLNSYMLTLASLILLGGSLGDRLGRRRIYLIGVIWFASASILCALSWNVESLIAARALQGVGGALLTPGSLAIISAAFVPGDRAAAVGVWSGLTGVSSAFGPILGGWLVQDVSWRWAFAINAPLAVAVVFLGLRYVPESRAEHLAKHLDIVGTLLVCLGLGAVTYGLIHAGSGWDSTAIVTVLGGVLIFAVFIRHEARTPGPLVPLDLFKSRTFTGTNIMTFFTYGALGALFTVLVLHLQIVAGYGAFAAGVSTLPITLALLILSRRSGALASRIGPRPQLIAGPLVAAVGMALMLRIDQTHNSYLLDVLPAVTVFGIGMALLVAPLTATVMAAAPSDEVGIASGVNNAVARAASLLAVAILPGLGGLHGENYRIPEVMLHGFRVVTICCVLLLLISAAVVALTVSGTPLAARSAASAAEPSDPDDVADSGDAAA